MIKFNCECGNTFSVKSELAAREVMCPSCKKIKTPKPLEVEDVENLLQKRKLKKALRRAGEPVFEASAFEPKSYKLDGDKIKFECSCGRKISVSVKSKKTVGRCPHCNRRLVVPDFRR